MIKKPVKHFILFLDDLVTNSNTSLIATQIYRIVVGDQGLEIEAPRQKIPTPFDVSSISRELENINVNAKEELTLGVLIEALPPMHGPEP